MEDVASTCCWHWIWSITRFGPPSQVRLLDKESKRALDDPDGLLEQVLVAWKNAGHLFRMVNCTGLLNLRFLQDRA